MSEAPSPLTVTVEREVDPETAARYYKLYIKYCPTAKDADQVRKMLGDYGGEG